MLIFLHHITDHENNNRALISLDSFIKHSKNKNDNIDFFRIPSIFKRVATKPI